MGQSLRKSSKKAEYFLFQIKEFLGDLEEISNKAQIFGGTAILLNRTLHLKLRDSVDVTSLKDLILNKETRIKKMYCYFNDFCEEELTVDKEYIVLEEPVGGTCIYHTLDDNNNHYNTMLERFRQSTKS